MRRTVSFRIATLLIGPISATEVHAADCDAATSVADVQQTINDIDAAYLRADTVAFSATQVQLAADVACANEVLPRNVVASVHRAWGLRAFAERDVDATYEAFAAAKSIEPTFSFSEDFLPKGHPIRADYERVDPASDTLSIPPPSSGYLLLDGSPSEQRPVDRAVLLQYISDKGNVKTTAYLMSGDRIPSLGTVKPTPLKRPPRKTTGWWIASAASAGLGALTYGIAATRRGAYESADIPEKPALRTQTNALVQTSAGFGGIAIGTAVIAVVGQRR